MLGEEFCVNFSIILFHIGLVIFYVGMRFRAQFAHV